MSATPHVVIVGGGFGGLYAGLKSIEDALEIRRRVFLAYEAAEREGDPVRRREWMSFVPQGRGAPAVSL